MVEYVWADALVFVSRVHLVTRGTVMTRITDARVVWIKAQLNDDVIYLYFLIA